MRLKRPFFYNRMVSVFAHVLRKENIARTGSLLQSSHANVSEEFSCIHRIYSPGQSTHVGYRRLLLRRVNVLFM